MSEKNVQLKRDDVVGNEVVSENINPKTDTSSVNDETTGLTLSESQRIMWNAINNKLSRVANSVNGRTGVIVLTKEDVGLGDVDNLSFADMLRRLEKIMMETFGKKRMRLFNNLHEVDIWCDRHNKDEDYVVSGSSFFSINGYNLDRKSYLGYIYLNEDDPANPVLEHTQLPINLSGWADMSMRWDKEWGVRIECTNCGNIMDWDGNPYTEQKVCDKCGSDKLNALTDESNTGRLGVNIARQERYIEVYAPVYIPGTILDEINKDAGGIRIRPGSLYGRFHYFTGMYGDGIVTTSSSVLDTPLLLRTTNTEQGEPVQIIIQDLDEHDNFSTPVTIDARLHPNWLWRDPHDPDHHDQIENPERIGGLREGDTLFISFRDYRTGEPPLVPHDMDERLMFRNDHIGIVTSAPSTWDSTTPYVITLNRIRSKVGWGMQHLNDRKSPADSFITLRLAKGNVGGSISDDVTSNLSGLQVIKGRHDPDITGFTTTSEIDKRFRTINLQTGPHTVFEGDNANRVGGLFINPDASLAIIPHRHYRGGADNDSIVENWAVNSPGNPDHDNGDQTSRHALEENSFIGINTTKLTHRPDATSRWKVGNASGLRVIDAGISLDMEKFYGVRSSDNHKDINFVTPHSGGLSINVGNFLEISPPKYDKQLGEFNEGGKLHIRVNPDKGLQAIDTRADNMMGVKINTNRAMHFRNDGTPNTIDEGVVTSGQQGQLEVNIGEVDQHTSYDKRRGLHFWQDTNDNGRLRVNLGTNTDESINRQRRGLTFAVPAANTEDETQAIDGQERLKIWLHTRNGLAFRGVTREYESDAEGNVIDHETSGQLGINYQHLLENLSNHTGRGIIIRDHRKTSGNPRDWRLETRLVGQVLDNDVPKSLGLEYEYDPTTNLDGIRAREWNGVLINNNIGASNGPDVYTKSHHGISTKVEPESGLMFKNTVNTVGDGAVIDNGQRPLMINIGKHHSTSTANRRRQGLTFETGVPIVGRHSTGTSHGWSNEVSTKLRVWDNTFRGVEFRGMPNSQEYLTTPYLSSLGSRVNTGYVVSGENTYQINPPMDPNENELTGMLQIKMHGGLQFRFRGDTWRTTNNPFQTTITSDTNSSGLARTPTRQDFQHGRIEIQPNRARGLVVSTVESDSKLVTTSDIYPKTGSNIGDLQLNINEKTGLKFTSDNILHHPVNEAGDAQLAGYTINGANGGIQTPSIKIPEYEETIPPAVINIPTFSVSNNSIPEGVTITPLPTNNITVTFANHDITISGNTLTVPERTVDFADTSVNVAPRNLTISRNTARLSPGVIRVSSRNVTISPAYLSLNFTLKPITPIVFNPKLTYSNSYVASEQTFDVDPQGRIIPPDQFTEDGRIIILPYTDSLGEILSIKPDDITIPSYETNITWSAVGSDNRTYTITRRVTVPSRVLSITNKPITVQTILNLYNDGLMYVRIPETDRFIRDQGKLRLIVDPNQGLGFNPQVNTGSETIAKNSSENPHDWQLLSTRRDINALRIKVNFSRGLHFRTDGYNPHNTYNLTNTFDDSNNKSGTNGQIEIKINKDRGVQFRLDGTSNSPGTSSSIPTSGERGQIEIKLNYDKGLEFRTDGTSNSPTTDGTIGQIQCKLNYDRGLEFDSNGRIAVKLNFNRGLEFDSEGKIAVKLNTLRGLEFDGSGQIANKLNMGIEFTSDGKFNFKRKQIDPTYGWSPNTGSAPYPNIQGGLAMDSGGVWFPRAPGSPEDTGDRQNLLELDHDGWRVNVQFDDKYELIDITAMFLKLDGDLPAPARNVFFTINHGSDTKKLLFQPWDGKSPFSSLGSNYYGFYRVFLKMFTAAVGTTGKFELWICGYLKTDVTVTSTSQGSYWSDTGFDWRGTQNSIFGSAPMGINGNFGNADIREWRQQNTGMRQLGKRFTANISIESFGVDVTFQQTRGLSAGPGVPSYDRIFLIDRSYNFAGETSADTNAGGYSNDPTRVHQKSIYVDDFEAFKNIDENTNLDYGVLTSSVSSGVYPL